MNIETATLTAVHLTIQTTVRNGGKIWGKILDLGKVDYSTGDGYGLPGEWLRLNSDSCNGRLNGTLHDVLPEGTVLLLYARGGSQANEGAFFVLAEVAREATLEVRGWRNYQSCHATNLRLLTLDLLENGRQCLPDNAVEVVVQCPELRPALTKGRLFNTYSYLRQHRHRST